MLIPACDEKIVLKKLGRDAAYTFKGLHKTADWLEITQKWLLLVPIVLSIAIIAFDSFIARFDSNVLIVVSLAITIYVILTQREYDKKDDLRKLANEFKSLFDELLTKYCQDGDLDLNKLNEEANLLRLRTANLPISLIGYLWCKFCINREMDLNWTKEKQENSFKG